MVDYFTDPLINKISKIPKIVLIPYNFNLDNSSTVAVSSLVTEKDDYFDILDAKLGPYESRKQLNTAGDSNPFESVSVPLFNDQGKFIREINSVFINRAALKLANLDYLFQLSNGVTTFLDVGAAPGGFSQYLQYRLPNAKGFGVSKRYAESDVVNRSLNWRKEVLDLTRFTILEGRDGSGDLLKHVPEFITSIPQKLDLVVADAGLEDMKEPDVYPLLIAEFYLGLATLRKGGKMIVKLGTSTSLATAELIYLFAQSFSQIYLLKILTSRQMNTEQYLVGIDYLSNNDVLNQLKNKYTSILAGNRDMPAYPALNLKSGFSSWLTQRNDQMCKLRRTMAQQYVNGKIWYEFANHTVLTLLDLPGPSLILYPSK
jgi:23S rRNA U2552 (ribose-2'-O)-methylase RlmE/FtsJ